MILTADEVGRSLSGSLKLLNRQPDGLHAFEDTLDAFWRSFAAIALTAPAFTVSLALSRAELGLPPQDGLFSDPWLVAIKLLGLIMAWAVFPLAMIPVSRWLSLGQHYVRFVVAYNWSAVLASAIFAVPGALLVLGAATVGQATLFAFAFGIIVAQYRWFIARAALGVSAGLASGIVMLDFGLQWAIASLVGQLT